MDTDQVWVPEDCALSGSVRDFQDVTGPALLARTEAFFTWQDRRRRQGLWPFSKSTDSAPTAECDARYDTGAAISGINLASQDYLGLSSHPHVIDAAMRALREHGAHSAGSPVLLGNTSYSVALEERLARFLHMEHCVLFPTGWAAGYSVAKGLVRPDDHVVMDCLAHACLQEGAFAATRNVHSVAHRDTASFRSALESIRATDAAHAILVITESLFSMDSDTPDLRALQAVCREFDATLVVDVAHDLGSLGPGGTGHLALQDMLDDVDLVMGSFSKTFASNGGFIATRHRPVKEYLKFFSAPHIFSNALSPVQAAVVLAALRIVQSGEGTVLRQQLMSRVLQLRDGLTRKGFRCLGDPSAIVPVMIGDEGLARVLTRALPMNGVLANLVEYPGVARGAARLRLQVMAGHDTSQIDQAIDGIGRSLTLARQILAERRRAEPCDGQKESDS